MHVDVLSMSAPPSPSMLNKNIAAEHEVAERGGVVVVVTVVAPGGGVEVVDGACRRRTQAGARRGRREGRREGKEGEKA